MVIKEFDQWNLCIATTHPKIHMTTCDMPNSCIWLFHGLLRATESNIPFALQTTKHKLALKELKVLDYDSKLKTTIRVACGYKRFVQKLMWSLGEIFGLTVCLWPKPYYQVTIFCLLFENPFLLSYTNFSHEDELPHDIES